MSYHPIYGIIFFFICLFAAYIFGKKSLLKKSENVYEKEKKIYAQDFFSPDAPWLDKNKKE